VFVATGKNVLLPVAIFLCVLGRILLREQKNIVDPSECRRQFLVGKWLLFVAAVYLTVSVYQMAVGALQAKRLERTIAAVEWAQEPD